MIRHIVFFSARRQEHLNTIYDGLCLLKGIPDCLHLEVSLNQRDDPVSQQRPDVVVYGEFASDAQLHAFKQHELYQRSINIVRPLREMRIAADVDADEDVN